MENFKKYTSFKKQFMDEHLCEVSSVVVKYASPHICLSFTGQKLPNALLSTSISYVQSTFKLQGKILPNDQYLYKCFYTPQTIPLFFKGRCQVGNSLTGTLIENDLEVQYKHTSANFAIKLKDNLTNLVISNTLGNEFLGFNAKLKTNLRCDEILKFNAGVYFVKKNCK